MDLRYDTYCGLYCGACDVLAATREGKTEELAKQWDMNPEDLVCHGCKTDTTSVYCRTCDMRHCAQTQKVDFCSHCTAYPCALLVAFRNDDCPHHSAVMKNLEAIRDKGVQQWLEEQKVRWSCPECGRPFTWYEKVCGKCGRELYNCEDEERDLASAQL